MNLINNVVAFTKNHAPEIMITAGVIGGVATVVLATKEKSKADLVLEKHNAELQKYKEVLEDESISEEDYSENDYNHDVIRLYCKTSVDVAMAYKWTIAAGLTSAALILGGFGIIKHRYVGMAAAYGALQDAYCTYRERVVNKYGEEADSELLYATTDEVVEETEVDEEGNEKTVTTIKPKSNPVINTIRISTANPLMIKYSNSYKIDRNASVRAFQNIVKRNIEEDMFNRSKVNGMTVAITANEIMEKLGYPEQIVNERVAAGVEIDADKLYGQSADGNVVGWTYNFNEGRKDSLLKELGLDASTYSWEGIKRFINGEVDFFYLTIPCEDIASKYTE